MLINSSALALETDKCALVRVIADYHTGKLSKEYVQGESPVMLTMRSDVLLGATPDIVLKVFAEEQRVLSLMQGVAAIRDSFEGQSEPRRFFFRIQGKPTFLTCFVEFNFMYIHQEVKSELLVWRVGNGRDPLPSLESEEYLRNFISRIVLADILHDSERATAAKIRTSLWNLPSDYMSLQTKFWEPEKANLRQELIDIAYDITNMIDPSAPPSPLLQKVAQVMGGEASNPALRGQILSAAVRAYAIVLEKKKQVLDAILMPSPPQSPSEEANAQMAIREMSKADYQGVKERLSQSDIPEFEDVFLDLVLQIKP